MDHESNSYASSRSRRTHRKSRMGCGNCKTRRVKCDETAPACNNCVRHSIKCDYGHARRHAGGLVPNQKDTEAPRSEQSTIKYAFISSSQSEFKIPKRARREPGTAEIDTLSPPETEPETAVAARPFQFDVTDMALLHHISSAQDLKGHIPDQLIRLGFSVHYVLRLLLAVSGFHLKRVPASDNLQNMPMFEPHVDFGVEAERHLSIAIEQVATTSPQLHHGNTHSLYIASVYIFICSLARGPRLGEYMAFRDDGDTPSLCLFMGIRSILDASNKIGTSNGISELHSGTNDDSTSESPPDPEGNIEDRSNKLNHHRTQSILRGYSGPLHDLRALISETFAANNPRHSIYHGAFDLLASRFDLILGTSIPLPGPELWPQIFSWLYMLPDVLVNDMQNKQPAALLLVSFFSVLLNELDSVWFIQGWPRHILNGVCQSLEDRYHILLSWPLQRLGLT
ncbi:Zn(II)2Cys6 transcription factor [Penicillium nucicola]|uniref:Zn(II)2Cys6 transcription factor n=1 Tax=Penicillium nucicola TaxID=1850975 RepID=UPI002544F80A|nr:Zn(II)2Cys6 transcription factor [Penicillium nucicola]KAJ5758183.1 Zn(II)2Cys6 transcription factor [Penicillium nucicola]